MKKKTEKIFLENGGHSPDVDIDFLCGKRTRSGYLTNIKFPSKTTQAGFGSSRAMMDGGFMAHNKQVGQTGKIVFNMSIQAQFLNFYCGG